MTSMTSRGYSSEAYHLGAWDGRRLQEKRRTSGLRCAGTVIVKSIKGGSRDDQHRW